MAQDCVRGLVSVIIPTYDRAHMITRALDSALGQEYRPIELIVVDDGSEDPTEEVVTSWIEKNARDGFSAHYVRQPNRGAPAARNNGLARSKGEFIQFLDSDDLMLPRKFACQVAALETFHSASFVWSDHSYRRAEQLCSLPIGLPDGEVPGDRTNPRLIVGAEKRHMPSVLCGGLFRRSACLAMGPWSEELQGFQDWEYINRFVASDMAALYLPGTHYVAVIDHGPQIRDRRDATSESYFSACRIAESMICDNSDGSKAARYRIALLYISASLAAMRHGDEPGAARAMRAAMRVSRGHGKLTAKLSCLRLLNAVLGGPLSHRIYAKRKSMDK